MYHDDERLVRKLGHFSVFVFSILIKFELPSRNITV